MLEIEVKFRVEDPEKMEDILKNIGAKKVDDGLENNIIFDKDELFTKAGDLLRIRSYNGKADITHKKKVQSEKFKVREETIVHIDSFELGKKLLEVLGFVSIRKYEKKRQTWEFEGAGILLDVMPFIGNFVEIEAPEEKIIEMAQKLGLDMKDAIKKSYRNLFVEFCIEKGLDNIDMTFKEAEK